MGSDGDIGSRYHEVQDIAFHELDGSKLTRDEKGTLGVHDGHSFRRLTRQEAKKLLAGLRSRGLVPKAGFLRGLFSSAKSMLQKGVCHIDLSTAGTHRIEHIVSEGNIGKVQRLFAKAHPDVKGASYRLADRLHQVKDHLHVLLAKVEHPQDQAALQKLLNKADIAKTEADVEELELATTAKEVAIQGSMGDNEELNTQAKTTKDAILVEAAALKGKYSGHQHALLLGRLDALLERAENTTSKSGLEVVHRQVQVVGRQLQAAQRLLEHMSSGRLTRKEVYQAAELHHHLSEAEGEGKGLNTASAAEAFLRVADAKVYCRKQLAQADLPDSPLLRSLHKEVTELSHQEKNIEVKLTGLRQRIDDVERMVRQVRKRGAKAIEHYDRPIGLPFGSKRHESDHVKYARTIEDDLACISTFEDFEKLALQHVFLEKRASVEERLESLARGHHDEEDRIYVEALLREVRQADTMPKLRGVQSRIKAEDCEYGPDIHVRIAHTAMGYLEEKFPVARSFASEHREEIAKDFALKGSTLSSLHDEIEKTADPDNTELTLFRFERLTTERFKAVFKRSASMLSAEPDSKSLTSYKAFYESAKDFALSLTKDRVQYLCQLIIHDKSIEEEEQSIHMLCAGRLEAILQDQKMPFKEKQAAVQKLQKEYTEAKIKEARYE